MIDWSETDWSWTGLRLTGHGLGQRLVMDWVRDSTGQRQVLVLVRDRYWYWSETGTGHGRVLVMDGCMAWTDVWHGRMYGMYGTRAGTARVHAAALPMSLVQALPHCGIARFMSLGLVEAWPRRGPDVPDRLLPNYRIYYTLYDMAHY